MQEVKSSFFTKLGVFVMRQGNLQEILQEDLYEFRETLEYIDLSYNQISYVDPEAFLDMIKLQVHSFIS